MGEERRKIISRWVSRRLFPPVTIKTCKNRTWQCSLPCSVLVHSYVNHKGQRDSWSSRITLGWIQTFVSPNTVKACMTQIIRMVKRLKHVTLWRQQASHPSLLYYNNLTSKQPTPFFSLTARNFSKLPISALRFPSSAICLIIMCKFYVLRTSKRDQSY